MAMTKKCLRASAKARKGEKAKNNFQLAGEAAARAGLLVGDCPFAKGSEARDYWEFGHWLETPWKS